MRWHIVLPALFAQVTVLMLMWDAPATRAFFGGVFAYLTVWAALGGVS